MDETTAASKVLDAAAAHWTADRGTLTVSDPVRVEGGTFTPGGWFVTYGAAEWLEQGNLLYAIPDQPAAFVSDEGTVTLLPARDPVLDALTAAAGPCPDCWGPGTFDVSTMPPKLREFWVHGKGAAQVGWGTPGSFRRCQKLLRQYLPKRMIDGACASLYHEATGTWPGNHDGQHSLASRARAARATFATLAVSDAQAVENPVEPDPAPAEEPPEVPDLNEEPEDEDHTSLCIVAVPAADDPCQMIGPEQKHATILFLGDTEDRNLVAAIGQAVAAEAGNPETAGPFTATVTEIGDLGPEGEAKVWLLGVEEDNPLASIRDRLLAVPEIKAAYDSIDQFPTYTPHVTIGYPADQTDDAPDDAWPTILDAAAEIRGIAFDRLAVWHGPDQQEHPMTSTPPAEADVSRETSLTAAADPADLDGLDVLNEPAKPTEKFHAVIAVEGVPSDDDRELGLGAGSSAELPLPWMYQDAQAPGHEGAVRVGRIDALGFWPDGRIAVEGTWDIHDNAVEARRQVKERMARGVSVDLAKITAEFYDKTTGKSLAIDDPLPEGAEPVMRFAEYKIRGATICSVPAFAAGSSFGEVEVLDGPAPEGFLPPDTLYAEDPDAPAVQQPEALVASGSHPFPASVPSAWFSDPGEDIPGGLNIDPDGRVYGFLAEWGTCHVGFNGGPNPYCFEPPPSMHQYGYFATGVVDTEDGKEVAVGQITMGTGHANPRLRAHAAAAHYDNTGAAVADVAMGENGRGIWVAGALREGVTDEQVKVLKAAGRISGDWRLVGRDLEVVGALAVNVPGYPIEPTRVGLDDRGEQISLVAAGVYRADPTAPPEPVTFTAADVAREVIARLDRRTRADLAQRAMLRARVARAEQFITLPWKKQRRVPPGHGRLSGRWVDMLNQPISEGMLRDFRGGSAEAHLIDVPGADGERKFSPDRVEFHDRFIQASLDGATPVEGRAPRYTMMGGGPAAGKSSLIRKYRGTDRDLEAGRAIVNADLAKTGGADEGRPDIPGIPEYEERVAAGDPTASSFVHEESSYMSKALAQAAIDNNVDVLLDGTGDSSLMSMQRKIAQARAKGYTVDGVYVDVPTELALVRAQIRGEQTGRMVPSSVVAGTHIGVGAIVPELLSTKQMDHIELWNTSEGGDPVKVMEFPDPDITDDYKAWYAPPKIYRPDLWDGFQQKANDTPEAATGRAAQLARSMAESEADATKREQLVRIADRLQAEADAMAAIAKANVSTEAAAPAPTEGAAPVAAGV